MIAIGDVYHLKCLTSFYNTHRSQQRYSTDRSHEINPRSLALAEVVSYIEEYGQLGGYLNHVFKLTNLKELNCERLQKLGGDSTGHIHSTRLAQKLTQHIPNLEVPNSKSGTVLLSKTLAMPYWMHATLIQMMKLSCWWEWQSWYAKKCLRRNTTLIVLYMMNNVTISQNLCLLWSGYF